MIDIFVAQGFVIESAASESGFSSSTSITNTKYGDQEDKIPDVIAYDPFEKQSIIGMVCQTDLDIDTNRIIQTTYLKSVFPLPDHPRYCRAGAPS